MDGARDIIVLAAELVDVERQDQTFLAGDLELFAFGIDDVPAAVPPSTFR
ncbi:hypothetical protein X743_09140 [Mesorhizobium sp. LNHC252B00]|nr:hypothetical protein X743_09140 [Mesorhizobium sp. LNHC252B00]